MSGLMIALDAAGVSDPGCKRSTNQDRVWLDTSRGVFAIADGMGGERCGELAAELAIRAVEDYVLRFEPSADGGWSFGYDRALTLTQNRVMNAVRLANKRVWDGCLTRPDCEGMGTTLSTVFVLNDTATIGSIGDSRVYLFRGNKLRQLTRDDAVVPRLLEEGEITLEESRTHPLRNVLTLALGLYEDVTVQLIEFTLKPGDRLLLCSDGLHGVVDTPSIQETVEASFPPDQAAQTLIQAARKRGGPDNISCIIVSCGLHAVGAHSN